MTGQDAAKRAIQSLNDAGLKHWSVNGRHNAAECAHCMTHPHVVAAIDAAVAEAVKERDEQGRLRKDETFRADQAEQRVAELKEALALAKSMILSGERMSEIAAAQIQAALLGVTARPKSGERP